MNTTEEYKRQLDQSGVEENSSDGQAYRKVFRALSREPEFTLPPQFADTVMHRLVAQQKKSTSRDNLFLILGVSLILITAVVGAVLSGFKPDLGAFKFLSGYPGLVIFGIVFITFIQWLDKKLVKKNLSV